MQKTKNGLFSGDIRQHGTTIAPLCADTDLISRLETVVEDHAPLVVGVVWSIWVIGHGVVGQNQHSGGRIDGDVDVESSFSCPIVDDWDTGPSVLRPGHDRFKLVPDVRVGTDDRHLTSCLNVKDLGLELLRVAVDVALVTIFVRHHQFDVIRLHLGVHERLVQLVALVRDGLPKGRVGVQVNRDHDIPVANPAPLVRASISGVVSDEEVDIGRIQTSDLVDEEGVLGRDSENWYKDRVFTSHFDLSNQGHLLSSSSMLPF